VLCIGILVHRTWPLFGKLKRKHYDVAGQNDTQGVSSTAETCGRWLVCGKTTFQGFITSIQNCLLKCKQQAVHSVLASHFPPPLFSPFRPNHRYGLIIAAVQLDLPHTLVKSIVVSMTESDEREGWLFVDDLPDEDVCDVNSWSRNPRMPIVLHYCGRYHLGKFFFSKYRLKKSYISCEAPLLTIPPKQVHTKYSYWVRPPPDRGFEHKMEVKNLTFVQAKREAFMLCGLISSVNEAARYFKSQHCNGTGNVSEIYNFHDDPYS
jgi:hypothetical protein